MTKFIAGLVLGLTISTASAQVVSYMYGQKIEAPVIDCGPTGKAVFVIDQGVPHVVPFTEDLLNRK